MLGSRGVVGLGSWQEICWFEVVASARHTVSSVVHYAEAGARLQFALHVCIGAEGSRVSDA
jgi:hypothetical protein